MAAGLPLILADERDEFEEWLVRVTDPITRRDGYEYALREVLKSAGVLAAHAAGALAWRRRRLECLRLVVDRYVAGEGSWVHHYVLGNNATALLPWMVEALKASKILAQASAHLAADPHAALSFVGGLAALKFLAAADPARMAAFLHSPTAPDFPVTFAPGLLDLTWVGELLEVGAAKGPQERELASAVFDAKASEFRAMCARLTTSLRVTSAEANARVGRFDEIEVRVDMRRWKEWCGE
jgi:hypothetical protein